MSIAANLTDGIRVDQATQRGSVYDVIGLVTGNDHRYCAKIFSRTVKQYSV